MAKCDCKGCESRYVGCHSNCESYKRFKDEKAKEYQKRRGGIELRSYIIESGRRFGKGRAR